MITHLSRTIGLSIVLLAACLSVGAASAATIMGQAGISGIATFNGPLATATAVTVFQLVELDEGTGTYAPSLVPAGTAVTVTTFTFGAGQFAETPVTPIISPLWTFTVGTTEYAFDLSSMSVSRPIEGTVQFLNISGQGVAKVTGYDNTPATFSFSALQSTASTGTTVGFSIKNSAVGAVVPEPQVVILLGMALLMAAGWRRRTFQAAAGM